MQREVYDTTKKDKNLYLKNLIETQDDLVDKQNLLNLNKKEIENLKSDLKKKDENIVSLKANLATIEDSLKTKKFEAERNKNHIDILKQTVVRLEKEIEGLKIKFEDVKKEKKKLDEEYKQTIINRDNLCKIFNIKKKFSFPTNKKKR
jgi:chromosome segregation ATPase